MTNKIWESVKQKIHGVEIDRSLNFDKYVSSLKYRKKLFVLAQLCDFKSLTRRRVPIKTSIKSQFRYGRNRAEQ